MKGSRARLGTLSAPSLLVPIAVCPPTNSRIGPHCCTVVALSMALQGFGLAGIWPRQFGWPGVLLTFSEMSAICARRCAGPPRACSAGGALAGHYKEVPAQQQTIFFSMNCKFLYHPIQAPLPYELPPSSGLRLVESCQRPGAESYRCSWVRA
jgi:hypothetical protein